MAKKSSEQITEEKKNEEKQLEQQEEEKQAGKKDHKKKKESASKKKSVEKQPGSAEIQEYEKQIKDLKEKYVRLSAEFDNYRKRTLREKTDMLKSAGEETVIKVLPVLDDFERAMGSMTDAKDVDAVKSGVELIYNKFREVLTQQGLKEIPAKGEEFDTDKHEAVTKIPAPEEDLKGKIVDVVEKGYYLNEKVIRYSKVIIGE